MHMKKATVLSIIVCLIWTVSVGQNRYVAEEKIGKSIHNVLSEWKSPKDSLLIYALNFELTVLKVNGKAFATNIVANDSLAFKIFPEYSKLKKIDFSAILVGKTKAKIVIPVIIFGSSPEQKKYKDDEGRSLISFNSAVNAAIALNDPVIKYSNERDAETSLSERLYKQQNKVTRLFTEAIFMRPYIIEIFNIR